MSTVGEKHILPSGELTCLEIFGNELTIVNCARVSFGKTKEIMDTRDEKLLHYLVRYKHFSPFRHVFLRFHIRAPEFVMRQWFKHVVGAEWTSCHASQLHGWNEISGRYVMLSRDDVYCPGLWREQSANNKQGSDGDLPDHVQQQCRDIYEQYCDDLYEKYDKLIELGVAKEQARILLPLSVMTEVIWTCSLQAAINFVELRTDPHAQQEVRDFALVIQKILEEHFPISLEAFRAYHTPFV